MQLQLLQQFNGLILFHLLYVLRRDVTIFGCSGHFQIQRKHKFREQVQQILSYFCVGAFGLLRELFQQDFIDQGKVDLDQEQRFL